MKRFDSHFVFPVHLLCASWPPRPGSPSAVFLQFVFPSESALSRASLRARVSLVSRRRRTPRERYCMAYFLHFPAFDSPAFLCHFSAGPPILPPVDTPCTRAFKLAPSQLALSATCGCHCVTFKHLTSSLPLPPPPADDSPDER